MSGIGVGVGIAIIVLLWIAPIFIAASITKDKGRGATIGVLLGFFLGWIGVVVAAVLDHMPSQTRKASVLRECPYCKEGMRRDAGTCPHCRNESPAWILRDGRWYRQAESEWEAIEERTHDRTWQSKLWLNVALVLMVLFVVVLIGENQSHRNVRLFSTSINASTIWLVCVSFVIGLILGFQGSQILRYLSDRNGQDSTRNLVPRYLALLVVSGLGVDLFLENSKSARVGVGFASGKLPVMWFILLCIAIGTTSGVVVSQMARFREITRAKLSKA